MRITGVITAFVLLFTTLAAAQGFGKNYIRDEDFKWRVLKTDHFDIYFYEEEAFLADYTGDILESAYDRQRDMLEVNLARRIPVIVYMSPRHFQQNNIYPVSDSIGGFADPLKHRLVMPFDGSQRRYESTLVHEFAHIMQFEVWYPNIGSLMTAVSQPAQWFVEGMPEHIADDWDPMGEMTLRDAVMNEYLPTVEELENFAYLPNPYLGYKCGQSLVDYLVEIYGEEVIGDIMHSYKKKTLKKTDDVLEEVIGMKSNELNDDWHVWVKKRYWPMIVEKQQLKEFSTLVTPRDDKDEYITYFKPQWSPSGDLIACLTVKDRFLDIFLINAETGEEFDNLTKGYSLNKYEYIYYSENGLSWSPDGDHIAFIGKKGTYHTLFIIEAMTGKVVKNFNPRFEDMLAPSWSPDGDKIAFTALERDKRDLYLYGVNDGTLKRVTEDPYSDGYPSWSPDGEYIYYTSERENFYNIFRIKPDGSALEQLTFGAYDNVSPDVSPDGETLLFSSDRYDGIYNLFTMDIESREVSRTTNVIGGVMDGVWSPDGDEIAFSSYENMIYSLYRMEVLKQPLDAPVVEEPEPGDYVYDPKTETEYFIGSEATDEDILGRTFIIEDEVLAGILEEEGEEVITTEEATRRALERISSDEEEVVLPDEVGQIEEPVDTPSPADAIPTVVGLNAGDVLSRSGNYKINFTPDTVYSTFSYTTGGVLQNYTVMGFSDLLSNHQFNVYFDLLTVSSLSDINAQVEYMYQTKKPTYAFGVYTWNGYYKVLGRYFTDRISGGSATMYYPFNLRNRVEFTLFGDYRERDYYDFDPKEFKPLGFEMANMLGGEIALVRDTSQWNYWTPIAGSRLRYSLTQTVGLTPDSMEYTSNFADLRRYFRISDRNSLAFRLVGGYNMGDDSPEYFVGGGDTVRGYSYSAMYGTWMGLFNAEFRFPLIDYVVTPIPGFVFGFFRGVAFFDIGTAWSDWDENSPYPEDHQWYTEKEDLAYTEYTPYTNDGGFHLVHLKPSFGTGFRWSMGFFDLKFDWAWPTDFVSVQADPVFHFTIGYDY